MRILAICGSLQASSGNLALLRLAANVMPTDVDYEIGDLLRHLPQFDPDLERNGHAPDAVVALRTAVSNADALLIASPEYGHSLPGSLKNASDWMIGTGEMEGAIVGITASVVHPARGRRGLDALLLTLAAMSAQVVGGTSIARGDSERAQVAALVDAVVEAVRARAASTVEP